MIKFRVYNLRSRFDELGEKNSSSAGGEGPLIFEEPSKISFAFLEIWRQQNFLLGLIDLCMIKFRI